MKNWKQHVFQKYVLVNRPVEPGNLKDYIHQDYLVSCINEMHENLGVESRESLRRDSEHLDQSSRDSSDTTIPTWEGKEPESKSKVVEEVKATNKVVQEVGVLPFADGKNINGWWLVFGALMLGNLATR